jgi:hypothetical protein
MRNISAAVHAGIAVLAGLAGACGQATASPGLPTPPLIPVAPGLAPGSYMYNYNVIPVGPPALFDARGIRAGATGDPASQATGMPGSALGPGPWKSNFLGTSANTRLHINAGEAPAQQSNTPGPVIGADHKAVVAPEDPGGAPPKKVTDLESSQPTTPSPGPGLPGPAIEDPSGKPAVAAPGASAPAAPNTAATTIWPGTPGSALGAFPRGENPGISAGPGGGAPDGGPGATDAGPGISAGLGGPGPVDDGQ